jgi:glycine oxidase
MSAAELARIEPALGPAVRSGYYLADRAQVRNPRPLKALAAACARRGVTLMPGCGASGFDLRGDRVAAVRTDRGRIACERVVLAAGPWSGDLARSVGQGLATPPIRGQIVLLRLDRPPLQRIIEHGRNYLVPRDDGRILIGATEEHAGFDTRPTAGAARILLEMAERLCPALADATLETTWAGLRPGSRDSRPYLGPLPSLPNLIVATGHGRAGLQLSPGTASLVADLVLGRPPAIPLDDFRPDRSDAPAVAEAEAFRS